MTVPDPLPQDARSTDTPTPDTPPGSASPTRAEPAIDDGGQSRTGGGGDGANTGGDGAQTNEAKPAAIAVLRERLAALLDSPSLARDQGTLWVGWRIGLWFLIMHAFFLIALPIMTAIGLAHGDGLGWASQALGLGQYLCCNIFLTLGAVLTLLTPIRATGVIEGPRWGRYFDQLTLSGITPARYFAGKVVAQNLFFVVIVAASLPYLVFAASLGGTRWSYLLESLLVLWLYANLLTLVTLALATMQHEVVAVLAVILFFTLAYILGLTPTPAGFACLSPARILCLPLYAVGGDFAFGDQANWWTGHEIGWADWGFTIPALAFYLTGAAVMGLVAALLLLLGPVPCMVRANATFGEVVLKGDVKKKRLLQWRYAMRRRGEMAFFYENRGPWARSVEGLLRYGAWFLLLCGLTVFPFLILHAFAGGMREDEFMLTNLVLACFALPVLNLFCCTDRSACRAPQPIGLAPTRAGELDTLLYGTLFLTLAVVVFLAPAARDLLETGWVRGAWRSNDTLAYWRMLLAVFVMAAVSYALARAFATRLYSTFLANLLAQVVLWILWLMPFLLGMLAFESRNLHGSILPSVFLLALTPLSAFLMAYPDDYPATEFSSFHPEVVALILQVFLAGIFAMLAFSARRRLDAERLSPTPDTGSDRNRRRPLPPAKEEASSGNALSEDGAGAGPLGDKSASEEVANEKVLQKGASSEEALRQSASDVAAPGPKGLSDAEDAPRTQEPPHAD